MQKDIEVYLGTDHRGFNLAEKLYSWLLGENVPVINLGAQNLDPDDDYVDYAQKVAEAVSEDSKKGLSSKGIVLCGSGVGVDVVANKIEGIRCGLALNVEQVVSARKDDDINILAIAADYTDENIAKEMIQSFLETEFDNLKRHERRIEKITNLEEQS
jgi:ribose 5-phosphate isomerase B